MMQALIYTMGFYPRGRSFTKVPLVKPPPIWVRAKIALWTETREPQPVLLQSRWVFWVVAPMPRGCSLRVAGVF